MNHPCVGCGETDPVVLEFDHVRGEKKWNVAMCYGRSMESLVEEIAKCEIRCANCHRRRTAEHRGWHAKVDKRPAADRLLVLVEDLDESA